MRTISADEAEIHFSNLLDAVARGETITITKHGVLVAQLVPPPSARSRDTAAVIHALREFRQGITLVDVPIRESIDAGRR